jgi:hypothetical protein
MLSIIFRRFLEIYTLINCVLFAQKNTLMKFLLINMKRQNKSNQTPDTYQTIYDKKSFQINQDLITLKMKIS